ncbi:MAG: methyltransferase domain-containing protein [Patescibacteria group bacterium]|nr:methyltransferase domain-containing protein [Patescibacteria group bacterium]MDE2015489.1 methyltransferase domain-containing protein [Patescibacteria group bacterium]MDE2226895.1 methyltransferase domain-containing protein [Patescibacteria group bacterium]
MKKPVHKKDTSWEGVAKWYDRMLEGQGTYQKDLILPNLLRLMEIKKGETVLDLACGQGFFAREFLRAGARVTGVDASRTLIALARTHSPEDIHFEVASAGKFPFIKNESVNKIAVVLALQNIDGVGEALRECARVLKLGGKIFIVMNHPAFRVPKASSWGWDDKAKIQYRRIDKYLSEAKVPIEMHPGDNPGKHTLSFHRPLQFYFKVLRKAGLAVTALEEWNSHKKSEPGPRAKAEDIARKEIPLFLCLAAMKIDDVP